MLAKYFCDLRNDKKRARVVAAVKKRARVRIDTSDQARATRRAAPRRAALRCAAPLISSLERPFARACARVCARAAAATCAKTRPLPEGEQMLVCTQILGGSPLSNVSSRGELCFLARVLQHDFLCDNARSSSTVYGSRQL